jgi:hypothetical protein
VVDLATKNVALVSKWLFSLLNEDETWKQMLKNKYLGSKSLSQVKSKPGDPHFCSGLMKMKNKFFK